VFLGASAVATHSMDLQQQRSSHYVKHLGVLEQIHAIRGGTPDQVFQILEFAPGEGRPGWTYISNGMSGLVQPCLDAWTCPPNVNVEVMGYTRERSKSILQVLEELANFPFDAGSCLAVGHVLPVDQDDPTGWGGYTLLTPHLEAATFSPLPFKVVKNTVHVLWVFPLLTEEVGFATQRGGATLETLVKDQRPAPFLDVLRPPLAGLTITVEREELPMQAPAPDKPSGDKPRMTSRKERKGIASRLGFGLFGKDKDAAAAAKGSPDSRRRAAELTTPETLEQAEILVNRAAKQEVEARDSVHKLERANEDLLKRIDELQRELEEHREDRRGLISDNRTAKEQLERAEAAEKQRRDRLLNLDKEIETAQKRIVRLQMDQKPIQASIAEKEQEKEKAEEELKTLDDSATEVTSRLEAARADADRSWSEYQELEQAAEEAERKAREARELANTAKQEAEDLKAKADELNKELEESSQQGQQLRTRVEGASKEIEDLTKELEELETEITAAEGEVESLKGGGKTDEETAVNEAEEHIKELKAQIEDTDRTLTEMNRNVERLEGTLASTRQDQKKVDEDLQKGLAQADELHDKHLRLQRLLERLEQEEIARAEAEAQEAQAAVEAAAAALEKARLEAETKLERMKTRRSRTGVGAGNGAAAEPEPAPPPPDPEPEPEPELEPEPEPEAGSSPVKARREEARQERIARIKESMLRKEQEEREAREREASEREAREQQDEQEE
jgi:hypothetical protein